MRNLVNELINLGVDLSTRNAFRQALKILGEEPDNADKLYVDLKNRIYRERIRKMDPKDVIVFIPHCMRKVDECKSKMTEEGYECEKCKVEKCKVWQVRQIARKRGHRSFTVPGGSMVLNIIKKYKPKGVIGIACMKELILALENIDVPGQTVELSKDGCINTDVDLEKVKCIICP